MNLLNKFDSHFYVKFKFYLEASKPKWLLFYAVNSLICMSIILLEVFEVWINIIYYNSDECARTPITGLCLDKPKWITNTLTVYIKYQN